jgi:hypothetical protein
LLLILRASSNIYWQGPNFFAGLPRLHDTDIDLNVLVFTLGLALLCSVLFGSIPALRYAGTRVGTGLRGNRTSSQGRERHRTRNTPVVIQVSLAFVLLICSGLMIRTFRALIHVDAGYYSAAKIQTVRLGIPEADVPKDDDGLRMQQAIAQKIATVPGVESVSFGGSVPMAAAEMCPLRRSWFADFLRRLRATKVQRLS